MAHQNNYTQRLHYLTMKHVLEPEHVLCTDNTQVNIHVRLLHMTLHYLTIKHVLETEHVLCTDNIQVNLHVRLLHTTPTLSYYKTCPRNRTCLVYR